MLRLCWNENRGQIDTDEDQTVIAPLETLQKIKEEEEPEELISEREKNANRAIRSAVFGLILLGGISIAELGHDHALGRVFFFFIFLGLEGYALLLLSRVFFSTERLNGGPRKNAKLAAWINGAVLLAFVLIVVMAFVGPIRHNADLRNYNHPEVMVGTWEGTFRGEKGEQKLTLELKGNGTIHGLENGAEESEFTGTWAYVNWTFYIHYDQNLQRRWPGERTNHGFSRGGFSEKPKCL